MSLEELKANMEKSKKELEHALHNKNILEQRKKLVERKERSHRLIVKGAEFEKAFPLSRDLEQEEVQDVMKQLQNSSYNKSIVRQVHIAALHKEQQQIAEAVRHHCTYYIIMRIIIPTIRLKVFDSILYQINQTTISVCYIGS